MTTEPHTGTEDQLSKKVVNNDPIDEDDDDEPDEWDQRILDTGCAEYNMKLLDCHAEKKDWRQCIPEMDAFKKCWEVKSNNVRTSTKDATDV